MEFSPGLELACYHNEKLFSTLDMFDVHSSQWTHWDIGLNSCGLMSLKMSTAMDIEMFALCPFSHSLTGQ